MFLNTRRFSVWLVSFLVVMVVYLIYNRMSRTPRITVSPSRQGVNLISDACGPQAGVGRVGQVGIETVKNVRYTKLDANKQVVGEFGFEELLHQDGNDWEIEEPYYTMYRRGFTCTIRGDRARVTVETSGGRVTPRQGLLTGNVTVLIRPKSKEGLGDAIIYFDDIFFVGETSLFSTTGMVEFVSQDVRLTGTGMELIYDGVAERLDLLKVNRLENLSIKRWSRGMVSGTTPSAGVEAGRNEKKTEKAGNRYRCMLENNVVIETFRERLLAEIVSINNIFMAGGSQDDSAGQTAGEISDGTSPGGPGTAMTRSAVGGPETSVVEKEGDVAISCEGGVIITPMDSALNREIKTVEADCGETAGRRKDDKAALCAGRIDYDAETGVVVAPGLSQIVFDTVDANRFDKLTTGQEKPATVAITSRKEMRFEPALNQVFFEGDCRCTVTQPEVNAVRQYFVLADKLEVGLSQKENAKAGTSLDVDRLVALGGDVRLASTKKIGERLLTGTELKCARMDYNVADRDFLATGPGLIKVDNSQTDEPQGKLARLSLRRKCYAFLRNFDTLGFNGSVNHLIADSNDGSLLMDYFPLAEAGPASSPQDGAEEKVAVTASRVEADIFETPGGRMELGALTATGAVTYEDKDLQFAGSELVFDVNNGELFVRGDKSRPALFNGAVVPGIQYNLRTGKVNTRITGPGAIK
ncbi:MAG: hypothetical protein JW749_05255 [Sedimentisphaerales bacterium]|nr:hypothetical protein [Sedimentisphaerales bacterium]